MQILRIFFAVLAIVGLASFGPVRTNTSANQESPNRVRGSLFSAAVLSETDFVAVGDRGRIFLSRDGAQTWQVVESNTTSALASVCFPDMNQGWIVGQGGVILHSSDGGKTWQQQTSGVDQYLLHVDFADRRHGFAVGTDSTVVSTIDGGKTWVRSPFRLADDREDEFTLFAVAMMDTQKVCIGGDSGRIFTTLDGGQLWLEARSPLYDEEVMDGRVLYALAYDSGTLYGVGLDGAFVRSRDQGRSWTEAQTGFAGPELYCIGVVDGRGLAAGSGGHVLQTLDGGASWRTVDVPGKVTHGWLSGISLKKCQSGDIRGLLVGENGTTGLLLHGKLDWH